MSSTLKKSGSTAPATLGDSLVDFGFVSTQVFQPSRGREVGITRPGLDKMVARGDFPKPVRLGKGPKAAIRWRLSDLRTWLDSRTPTAA